MILFYKYIIAASSTNKSCGRIDQDSQLRFWKHYYPAYRLYAFDIVGWYSDRLLTFRISESLITQPNFVNISSWSTGSLKAYKRSIELYQKERAARVKAREKAQKRGKARSDQQNQGLSVGAADAGLDPLIQTPILKPLSLPIAWLRQIC